MLECLQTSEKLPVAVLPTPTGSMRRQPHSMSRTIPLTQGYVAVVDDKDYEWLSQWKWCAKKTVLANGRIKLYAHRRIGNSTITMHRLIVNAGSDTLVDHADGNGLNNRRCNLRQATVAANCWNSNPRCNTSSRYKGVSWHKRVGKWAAAIRLCGRSRHLGYFADEVEAARAYDRAAKEHFGEFARLNFPNGAA